MVVVRIVMAAVVTVIMLLGMRPSQLFCRSNQVLLRMCRVCLLCLLVKVLTPQVPSIVDVAVAGAAALTSTSARGGSRFGSLRMAAICAAGGTGLAQAF